MNRIFIIPLLLCAVLLFQACIEPCETQSFYFAGDTITFPIDVATVRRKNEELKLTPNYPLLYQEKGDTLKGLRFSTFEEDRFAPDRDDDHERVFLGADVVDTLGKGIYSYCYYLPDTAYDETFRYLVGLYGKRYQKKGPTEYSSRVYYVWDLSDCTRLVCSLIPISPTVGSWTERKTTFVEFVHRLDDREIDNTVHLGGPIGSPFD